MNHVTTESGQAPVMKYLGMPAHVRSKFDTLISGQATAEGVASLADSLICEVPVTNLQLILVPLLLAYHQVHHASQAAPHQVAREFATEASTNDVPHWDEFGTTPPSQEL